MSAPTETTNLAIRTPALIVGLMLIALGASGLLDDSGAIPHPPWTIAVGAVATAAVGAIAHTIRQLRATHSEE